MRKFPAHQLAETENELASLAELANRVSWDVGEHSDSLHWNQAVELCAAEWLAEVQAMKGKLTRAEGLLNAYELVRKAKIGEGNDDTAVG